MKQIFDLTEWIFEIFQANDQGGCMWRWKAIFTAVHLLSLGDRHILKLSDRASDVLSLAGCASYKQRIQTGKC